MMSTQYQLRTDEANTYIQKAGQGHFKSNDALNDMDRYIILRTADSSYQIGIHIGNLASSMAEPLSNLSTPSKIFEAIQIQLKALFYLCDAYRLWNGYDLGKILAGMNRLLAFEHTRRMIVLYIGLILNFYELMYTIQGNGTLERRGTVKLVISSYVSLAGLGQDSEINSMINTFELKAIKKKGFLSGLFS